jgi:hypothetical protein
MPNKRRYRLSLKPEFAAAARQELGKSCDPLCVIRRTIGSVMTKLRRLKALTVYAFLVLVTTAWVHKFNAKGYQQTLHSLLKSFGVGAYVFILSFSVASLVSMPTSESRASLAWSSRDGSALGVDIGISLLRLEFRESGALDEIGRDGPPDPAALVRPRDQHDFASLPSIDSDMIRPRNICRGAL